MLVDNSNSIQWVSQTQKTSKQEGDLERRKISEQREWEGNGGVKVIKTYTYMNETIKELKILKIITFCVRDRVLLCSTGWSGIGYVCRASWFWVRRDSLPVPPECQACRGAHHHTWLRKSILKMYSFYFMCIECTAYMPGTCRVQKRGSDLLELELRYGWL